MEIPLLTDVVIIFSLSIAVIFIFQRVYIPAVVGFFLTGILVGPHGLRLVSAVHEVEVLAEIGVILLLFTIGLEFSLADLLRVRRLVLVGGSLQVTLTGLVVFGLARQFNLTVGEAIFVGFLVALSSTAIVLKLLQERGEIDSPQGRTTLAILIFQDIIIVPMVLFTPLLAGSVERVGLALVWLVVKGVGVIVAVSLSAKYVVPYALHQIARTRSRELFLLSILTMGSAVAWITSSIGLSLALGAFLAGLIISESEYSHQAFSNVLPFRDVFTSFFFVSIGMLLDVRFLFDQPGLIVLLTLSVLIIKTLAASLAATLLGLPLRTTILVGLGLSQVGEFSFILSNAGLEFGLLAGERYQLFLAVSILTMALAPFIIALAPRVADRIVKLPFPQPLQQGFYPTLGMTRTVPKDNLADHVIIIGFGLNGRNVAHATQLAGVPHVIIELNPETVRQERSRGEPIYYGDAVQEAVLEHAGIKEARAIVIVISDPTATRRITAIARKLRPEIYIIARTRYLHELKPLYDLGADEVIPEEFETSVEIFARVLRKYRIPGDEIEQLVATMRADGYKMFRGL
jgi:monovalent cation:H+ antiporter-2, CPA2 family